MRKIAHILAASTFALAATSGVAFAEQNDGGYTDSSAGAPNVYPPNARAAARIGQSGAVQAAIGFTKVTSPSTGIFCLTVPSYMQLAKTSTPIVTIEWGSSLGVALYAQWYRGAADCGPRDIEVRTYKGDTGGVGSALQVPVLSDQVAFQVVLP